MSRRVVDQHRKAKSGRDQQWELSSSLSRQLGAVIIIGWLCLHAPLVIYKGSPCIMSLCDGPWFLASAAATQLASASRHETKNLISGAYTCDWTRWRRLMNLVPLAVSTKPAAWYLAYAVVSALMLLAPYLICDLGASKGYWLEIAVKISSRSQRLARLVGLDHDWQP